MDTEIILKLLGSWAGIPVLVAALTQAVKKLVKPAAGFEPQIAVVLGLALAITSKALGLLPTPDGAVGWVAAIIGGLVVGGGGGQLIHDYVMNPSADGVRKIAGKPPIHEGTGDGAESKKKEGADEKDGRDVR